MNNGNENETVYGRSAATYLAELEAAEQADKARTAQENAEFLAALSRGRRDEAIGAFFAIFFLVMLSLVLVAVATLYVKAAWWIIQGVW